MAQTSQSPWSNDAEGRNNPISRVHHFKPRWLCKGSLIYFHHTISHAVYLHPLPSHVRQRRTFSRTLCTCKVEFTSCYEVITTNLASKVLGKRVPLSTLRRKKVRETLGLTRQNMSHFRVLHWRAYMVYHRASCISHRYLYLIYFFGGEILTSKIFRSSLDAATKNESLRVGTKAEYPAFHHCMMAQCTYTVVSVFSSTPEKSFPGCESYNGSSLAIPQQERKIKLHHCRQYTRFSPDSTSRMHTGLDPDDPPYLLGVFLITWDWRASKEGKKRARLKWPRMLLRRTSFIVDE